MSGIRTYILILFFWALLTIVTPMLVRMSASANLYKRLDGERREGVIMSLLPRRALIAEKASQSPAPAPAVEDHGSDGDGRMAFPMSSRIAWIETKLKKIH